MVRTRLTPTPAGSLVSDTKMNAPIKVKTTVTHICGHAVEYVAFGTTKEREAQVRFSERCLCSGCFRARYGALGRIYSGARFTAQEVRDLLRTMATVSVSVCGSSAIEMTGAAAADEVEDSDAMEAAVCGGQTPSLQWDRGEDDYGYIAFPDVDAGEDVCGFYFASDKEVVA